MANTKIEDIKVGQMPESMFLKPYRMEFKQNGRSRYWDFVKLHESVSIVIFNTSRNVLVFVKQFRPAVFYSSAISTAPAASTCDIDWTAISSDAGMTLELCAGILDNPKLNAAEIAKQEALEECGYDVPLSNFQRVLSYRSGVGVSGDKQTLYYAEVTDSMRISEGGGNTQEGEFIDVIEMTIPEVKKYISQENVLSPGGFLFAVQWFLANKVSQLEAQ